MYNDNLSIWNDTTSIVDPKFKVAHWISIYLFLCCCICSCCRKYQIFIMVYLFYPSGRHCLLLLIWGIRLILSSTNTLYCNHRQPRLLLHPRTQKQWTWVDTWTAEPRARIKNVLLERNKKQSILFYNFGPHSLGLVTKIWRWESRKSCTKTDFCFILFCGREGK